MNRSHRLTIVPAVVGGLVLATAPAGAAVWFVDDDAASANNGTTWTEEGRKERAG